VRHSVLRFTSKKSTSALAKQYYALNRKITSGCAIFQVVKNHNLILQSDTVESKSRVYFARMKVKGKLIRRSLKPNGANPMLHAYNMN
jgi:hypothetical protein